MNSIDPISLKTKLDANEDIFLLDVREEFEHVDFNIGGELMPMNSVGDNVDRIPKDKPVIVYCAKGVRSGIVIQRLEEKYGYTNLVNLEGGIFAWKSATR